MKLISTLISLLIIASQALAKSLKYYNVVIENKCVEKVEVAIYYEDLCGTTDDYCGWTFDRGEKSYMALNGDRIRTEYAVYLYARTKSGSVVWDTGRKTITRTCRGRKMKMFLWDYVKDGNIFARLSCDTRDGQGNLRSGSNATDVVLTIDDPNGEEADQLLGEFPDPGDDEDDSVDVENDPYSPSDGGD